MGGFRLFFCRSPVILEKCHMPFQCTALLGHGIGDLQEKPRLETVGPPKPSEYRRSANRLSKRFPSTLS